MRGHLPSCDGRVGSWEVPTLSGTLSFIICAIMLPEDLTFPQRSQLLKEEFQISNPANLKWPLSCGIHQPHRAFLSHSSGHSLAWRSEKLPSPGASQSSGCCIWPLATKGACRGPEVLTIPLPAWWALCNMEEAFRGRVQSERPGATLSLCPWSQLALLHLKGRSPVPPSLLAEWAVTYHAG